MSGYQVPESPLEVEEVIKGSQFITRVRNTATVEEAKAFIHEMNDTYPDATHHCWAYIVGNPASTTLLGCSDDGEPSGTAGKPMLTVLQHSGIGDITLVCTRYYGGTKLGTGGLARAYGGGAKLAIEQLTTSDKIERVSGQIVAEYDQAGDIEHLLKSYNIENLQIDYASTVIFNFDIAEAEQKDFEQSITNKFKGKVSCIW